MSIETRPTPPPLPPTPPPRLGGPAVRQGALRRGWAWLGDQRWLFILPAFIFFLVFNWYPLLKAVEVSVYDQQGTTAHEMVGLRNYEAVLTDEDFRVACVNTVEYMVIRLALGFALPIIVAIMINEMRRFTGLLRLAYFMPMVTSLVLTAVVWKWIFNPQYGAINTVLGHLGIPGPQWIQSESLVLPSLATVAIWYGLGHWMLIYLAGLQGIPRELYEASAVDGAGFLRRIWHITLPQLLPVMRVVIILTAIAVAQLIVEPMVMTGGGPNRASLTISLYIFVTAFQEFNLGKAAAASMFLFAFLILITFIQLRFARRS
jgi:multiple sugar transport system permease protein